ncbi:MAG: phage portal protein [Lachnospiraceae bacterium]|nr:phage portal protein [Lachnospiraceae bacterium]
MQNLTCFLANNVEKRTNKKVVISERIKNNGKPVEWEIRSISAEEDEVLRKSCTKKVPVTGKKNQFTQDFDSNAYLVKLAAKAVVYPDLNNAELQNSYGVMGAEQLIKVMLYKDEFDRLTELLVNSSEAEDINELIEEAKN